MWWIRSLFQLDITELVMKVVLWKGFILLCSHNIEESAGKLVIFLLMWFEYVNINGMDKTSTLVFLLGTMTELQLSMKSNRYFGDTR